MFMGTFVAVSLPLHGFAAFLAIILLVHHNGKLKNPRMLPGSLMYM